MVGRRVKGKDLLVHFVVVVVARMRARSGG